MKRTTLDLSCLLVGGTLLAYGAWARASPPVPGESPHQHALHPANLLYRPLMTLFPASDASTLLWAIWGLIGAGALLAISGFIDFVYQRLYRT